jgi:hypothetical protein
MPGDEVFIWPLCGGLPGASPTSSALTEIKRIRYVLWSAKVRNVGPGPYPVTLTCPDSGDTANTTLTVLAPAPAPVPPKQEKPQVPVKPKGAPQTGGGGIA